MARKLLITVGMLVLGATLLSAPLVAGCILPPELEAGSFDAGPSSAPVILSSGPAPDFQFPGPIILERQDSRTLSLTVLDNDIDDIIHLRLYIDYGRPDPEPAYAECQAAPTGERTRVLACPMNSICNSIEATDQTLHLLEAMVADREFLADSDPAAEGQSLFRALQEPSLVGFSFRTWQLRCNAPDEL